MSAICKYIKRPNGDELFITRRCWSRCVTPDKSRPLPGHLVMVTNLSHEVKIIRVPTPFHGFTGKRKVWKIEEEMWFELCKAKNYVWWSYLTPCALPPVHPKKKRYTDAELSRGHVRLTIIMQDQEVGI